MNISYGTYVADDSELRLCGDVSGKRVIELGVFDPPNAVVMATAGAKTIAVDPSADTIARLRSAAEEAEVRVECHQGDLADLGFVTSGSVDLVVAAHSLDNADDLPRLLRQVHRVLRSGGPFVVALRHPVAAMFDGGDTTPRRRYGDRGWRFGELYMTFERANFHFDTVHELADRRSTNPLAPAVLVIRARKQGV